MTGKHEVISPLGCIPKGVLGRDDAHVIRHELSKGSEVVGERLVEVLHHPRNTEGHEINVSTLSISGSELPISMLDLVYEPSFYRIYVLTRSIVDHGHLPFFIHVHLQPFLHLHVALIKCAGVTIHVTGGDLIIIFSVDLRRSV